MRRDGAENQLRIGLLKRGSACETPLLGGGQETAVIPAKRIAVIPAPAIAVIPAKAGIHPGATERVEAAARLQTPEFRMRDKATGGNVQAEFWISQWWAIVGSNH